MTTIDEYQDVLDVRDIIERVEELRDDRENCDDAAELSELEELLGDLAGYGGDEQWQGDWYPVILVRDSYFVDYARELLEDCGDIPRDLPHYLEIDWDATARNIRVDYSAVEFRGVTYWYR